jgi:hypothetical protein
MKEWILSRRDQTKVAWHEVPGNKRKVEPVPKGRLICSLVPEDEFRFALRYHRDKARGALGLLGSRSEPVP